MAPSTTAIEYPPNIYATSGLQVLSGGRLGLGNQRIQRRLSAHGLSSSSHVPPSFQGVHCWWVILVFENGRKLAFVGLWGNVRTVQYRDA